MDWEGALSGFRMHLKIERGMSEHTIDAYQRDVQKLLHFARHFGEKIYPSEVTTEIIKEFIHSIGAIGIEPRSQARIISGLRTFFNYLILERAININPVDRVQSPKLGQKLPEVLTYGEVRSIIEAVDLSTNLGHRNRAILETLYACGLRVSELTELKLSNIFFDLGLIKVVGKNNKERLIPIAPSAVRHIRAYLDHERRNMKVIHPEFRDHLFLNRRGKSLTRNMIFLIVKQMSAEAGITKKVSPHTFRHAFATHLVEGGADLRAVQEMLGHESITTTEIYTHLSDDYLRDTIMMYHPMNK